MIEEEVLIVKISSKTIEEYNSYILFLLKEDEEEDVKEMLKELLDFFELEILAGEKIITKEGITKFNFNVTEDKEKEFIKLLSPKDIIFGSRANLN